MHLELLGGHKKHPRLARVLLPSLPEYVHRCQRGWRSIRPSSTQTTPMGNNAIGLRHLLRYIRFGVVIATLRVLVIRDFAHASDLTDVERIEGQSVRSREPLI